MPTGIRNIGETVKAAMMTKLFRNSFRIFLLMLLSIGVCNCATGAAADKGLAPLSSGDMARLERENTELRTKVDDLLQRVLTLSQSLDDQQVKLDYLAEKIRTLETQRGEIGYTVPNTSEQLSPKKQLGTDLATKDSRGAAAEKNNETIAPLDPATLYEKGLNSYRDGKFQDSMITFKEFLTLYPDNARASNAQYWLGECTYSLGDYSNALSAFSIVLQKYPLSGKIQDAMVKKGFCLMMLGRKEEAVVMLQQVIDQFPSSTAAEKARQKIEELSSGKQH